MRTQQTAEVRLQGFGENQLGTGLIVFTRAHQACIGGAAQQRPAGRPVLNGLPVTTDLADRLVRLPIIHNNINLHRSLALQECPHWGYPWRMRQQDMLRAAMKESGQTRRQMAEDLGVSVRALDKWLLPESSRDFRRMPETALRLLAARHGVRRSTGLTKPYDWSNAAMTDDALILAVLRRAEFSDLVQVCIDQGLDRVKGRVETALGLVSATERPILARILARMLRSIELALADGSGQRNAA